MAGLKVFILIFLLKITNTRCGSSTTCTHGEIVQDPLDVSCRSFYLCAHGHQMLMTCAPGTMFDAKSLSCQHMTMVACSTLAASTMKSACTANFGVFANPVDPTCSTFVQCSWKEPYVRDCNPGYLFNAKTKKCDSPANVECEVKLPKLDEAAKKALILNSVSVKGMAKSKRKNKLVCYYPNYAFWRKAMGKFSPSDIDPTLCTHLIYAFFFLDGEKLVIKPSDVWLDVEKGNLEEFNKLKIANPNMKTMIALGGWVDSNDNREAYNLIFNNDKARATFIKSVVDFLEKWNFDGLDIAFEFPQINERQGFVLWIEKIKEAFGDKYELSVQVPANTKRLQEGYAIEELSKSVDGLHVMAYDMHGPWESTTDHHAPLFRRKWDTTYNYIDATVQSLIDHGAPAEKIVLGIPTYGRSWSIKDPKPSISMQPPVAASGAAPAGFLTKASGSMGYQEICMKVKNAGWIDVDDPEGPYAFSKDKAIWVGYDSPGAAADKASYILARGLGGAMIWDLPQDDFSNACGRGKFPILRAIKKVLDAGATHF